MRINPIDPIYRTKKHKRNRAEQESPWSQYGTDADYQAWCRTRPSAYNPRNNPSNSKIEYCHYRTAANSGIGCKPPYSGIPMTMQEHQLQHRVGTFNFMSRERWEYLVNQHLEMWAASKACK